MNQSSRSRSVLIGALVACLVIFGGALAGSLTPPGPPAPTMKTIVDVEPRTAIHGSNLPLTINVPGSYYLAESITTAGNGITISASDVTIDLRGFTLRGGTGDGISVLSATPAYRDLVIEHGTVAGWSQSGVNLGSSIDSGVVDVLAVENGFTGFPLGNGIILGDRNFATRCVASRNANYGILGSTNEKISACVAQGNGVHGIAVAAGSLVENSVANGDSIVGIVATGSRVSGCEASGNGYGIYSSASTISECTVKGNSFSGIYSAGSNHLVNNLCVLNVPPAGQSGGYGIYAGGSGDVIEGNSALSNHSGIVVISGGNIIVKNTATGNGVNYSIAASNDLGPFGSATAATSPWANIDF